MAESNTAAETFPDDTMRRDEAGRLYVGCIVNVLDRDEDFSWALPEGYRILDWHYQSEKDPCLSWHDSFVRVYIERL